MNVWIINLKDNRTEKPDDLEQTKFDFCLNNGIIGIGWVGYEEKPADFDTNYTTAKNLINQFRVGDLVWTHSPDGIYYLCRVTTTAKMSDDAEYNKNDIGLFCSCEFHRIGDKSALPTTIDVAQLVCSGTINAVIKLADATHKFAKERKIVSAGINKSAFAGGVILFAIFALLMIDAFTGKSNGSNETTTSTAPTASTVHVVSLKSCVPTKREYMSDIMDAHPKLKEWYQYDEDMYMKDLNNSKKGLIATTVTGFMYTNPADEDLFVYTNDELYSDHTPLCGFTKNCSFSIENLSYLELFLKKYPDRLSATQLMDRFNLSVGVVSEGIKRVTFTYRNVRYEMREKTDGSWCSANILLP